MKILGVRVDGYSKNELTNRLIELFDSDEKTKISKINTEFIHKALKDKGFAKILNYSDMNIVDGRGVLWSARYLTLPISNNYFYRRIQATWQMVTSGARIVFSPRYITYPIKESIPGVEAFKTMLRASIDARAGVFLFGSSQKTLDLAEVNILKEFPKVKIAGKLNGYDFQKDTSIDPVAEINKTDAKLLIVALGCPKQEMWINDNIDKLTNIRVAVGEGGTLDRIAYPFQESPVFMNNIGLEWFWRLIFNPSKQPLGADSSAFGIPYQFLYTTL